MLLEIHVMIIDNKPTAKLINKSIEKIYFFSNGNASAPEPSSVFLRKTFAVSALRYRTD